MKITIITVTYNSASTILETLASVARQTYPEIEHIVVDGASTDGTQALIAAHRPSVSKWISEPDQGIYDAMNKGLRLASGEFVGFLNGDDTLADADVIRDIVDAVHKEAPDAVFGDLVYVDPSRPKPLVRYWRTGEFAKSKLKFGWMPPHPTLYVRRQVFDRIGPFDATLRIAADYDFMMRLLTSAQMKVAYVRRVLVKMRIGGASNASAQSMYKKSKEDFLVIRRHHVGGWPTLFMKNVRKLSQFFAKPGS